ncbi:amidohydrolase [Aeromicrobium wangtongii]|uniref:amidohydrolase n=1 Tax=Aeromicrobium wangtongii TaxID=2969247 RepID=UPI00201786AF|nr:amidohydrolase [Aeromicrobium wangtongii]MCL3816962.1 amidohydrolase [Aeromicrobium wangtongii]
MNGNVLTMDDVQGPGRPTAIAVSGGVITYVGDDTTARSLGGDTTEVVDLDGRTVLPGFIESHAHPTVYGTNLLDIDCRPQVTGSVDRIQAEVEAAARAVAPGEWILGWGWDESRMENGIAPTRDELDRAAPDNPVLLRRVCGHMAVVNSAALRVAGVEEDTPDPDGGHLARDAGGRLTGLLQEQAQSLVSPPDKTSSDIARGFRLAQAKYASWGITTIHDMSTRGADLRVYQELLNSGELDIRLRPWFWAIQANYRDGVLSEALTTGLASGFGNDMLKIQGVKFMLDGSVGGRTAALAEPFEDSHDCGILTMGLDETAPWVVAALDGGLRVAIHGIGERAIDVAIQACDLAAAQLGAERVGAMRNRIEHCALPTEQNLQDMVRLGLVAASSIGFVYSLGDSYLANLGPERVSRVYPHKSFQEHGIVAPGNSDSPVTEGNPWLGIYAAVTRTTHSGQVLDTVQNISVQDALRAYTRDAAYASFEEDRIGVIRPGAKADLNVVSQDPLTIDPQDLPSIQTVETYLDGRKVYSAR